ncbi:CHAT domain-containing protein [Lentzea sp. PSKA42]|uniref:CHAT domain-containing protein n=1 Tax=Lentzea indica TaxID=2604800 RepID=A0ABX1FH92_9PSEU|nr:CHAT domain-containing tetratricopeptide repeat protein [Lentzea indica]NKE58145.1 CHAT domain-containing protein [Lentzea indica]
MSFDELLRRVRQRVEDCQRLGQADGIVADSAATDAIGLWQAAQPSDPERPTPEDDQRLAMARHALGWLSHLRWTAQPTPDNVHAFIDTVVFLAPVANTPASIPEPLRQLLGPTADVGKQVGLALGLADEARSTSDLRLLDTAVILLSTALATTPATHPGRADVLWDLCVAHDQRYGSTGSLADLDQVIDLGEQVVATTATAHPGWIRRMAQLGVWYGTRFQRTGVLADLDRAIDLAERTLDLIPVGDPDHARTLSNLGISFEERYRHTQTLAHLDLAIDYGERAASAIPADHPDRGRMLSMLGANYQRRFQRTNVLADLNRAVEHAEQALEPTPSGHPDHSSILSDLSDACRSRFKRVGAVADLDRAIDYGERAVAETPTTHPHHAGRQIALSFVYQQRFERVGVLADLNRAIELAEQAEKRVPTHHPEHHSILAGFCIAYRFRFERTSEKADLDRAIEYGEQAVTTTDADQPGHGGNLINLALAYFRRFQHADAADDVARAIDYGERAVLVAAADPVDRAMRLTTLGTIYHQRFERTDTLADANRGIDLGEQAVELVPTGHPERAIPLSALSYAYHSRFRRAGAVADVDRAIDRGEQAVAATPADHPDRGMSVSNLSLAYRGRFEHTGMLADLDRAIDYGEQAVALTSTEHPDRTVPLANLGSSYLLRFEHTGVSADLDRAIDCDEQAVATADHHNHVGYLTNLSVAYLRRFQRTGVLTDLDHAIDGNERAVDATPADHPDRAMGLSNLGIVYLLRFERTGAPADLGRVIECGEQAVAAAPADHFDRAGYLSNLGNAYTTRFTQTKVMADLDRAIDYNEQAVTETPTHHPRRAMRLSNLVGTYLLRFEQSGQGVGRETLATLAAQTAAETRSSPQYRVQATSALGRLAHAMNEDTIAAAHLDAAVAMVPLVAPWESGLADQEHRLAVHGDLAGEAVAVHCALGNPVTAVEAAELARGVALAAQMDSRTDLTDLDRAHPELATSFRRVRDGLTASTDIVNSTTGGTIKEIDDRKRLWAEHDELLAQIRRHPAFTRFQLPPRFADLRPAAGEAVVLVNAGPRRGDAVIITSEAVPVHIGLPGLAADDVHSQTRELLDAIDDGSPISGVLRRKRVVPNVLGWLWDAVVEPVLGVLPTTTGAGETLPRVWWMPVGLLGLLPLHAAGHPGVPGALDRVVSSYTPTLRALAHTRAQPPAIARRQLTVALAQTPGLPDLPGTTAEAATLHAHHSDTPPLVDHAATTGHVLAALSQATWAHFACHASANLTAPSHSGLSLHDGPLRVPDISRLQLPHAELAYLSACSTARSGRQFADQALHLASAFQLAGFRHVIASLWPLNDHIAATAAAAFYDRLPATPTADRAAFALHAVTQDLRVEYPDRPDLWAALIHSGA